MFKYLFIMLLLIAANAYATDDCTNELDLGKPDAVEVTKAMFCFEAKIAKLEEKVLRTKPPTVYFLKGGARSNSSVEYIDFSNLEKNIILKNSASIVVNFAGTFFSQKGKTNGHVKLVVNGLDKTEATYINSGEIWNLVGVPLTWGGSLNPGVLTIKIMWAKGDGIGKFESRDATMTITIFE